MEEICTITEFRVVLVQILQRLHCWLFQCPMPNWCSLVPPPEPVLDSDGPARILHFAGMMLRETLTGKDKNPPMQAEQKILLCKFKFGTCKIKL